MEENTREGMGRKREELEREKQREEGMEREGGREGKEKETLRSHVMMQAD